MILQTSAHLMTGPRGNHNNHDAYDGAEPVFPAPQLKQINAADKKVGPRKPGTPGQGVNLDSYFE